MGTSYTTRMQRVKSQYTYATLFTMVSIETQKILVIVGQWSGTQGGPLSTFVGCTTRM